MVKEYCSYLNLKYYYYCYYCYFHFFNARKMNFMRNARKNTFNRWGMLMQIILVKLTLDVTCNCQKIKKITVSFPGKTPLKLKQKPKKKKKKKNTSNNYHPTPAASTAGPCPTIAVLQQCADEMTTVQTLIRPIPKEQADLSLHCLSI